MGYVCDVLYTVLYVHVNCLVVHGCAVSMMYIVNICSTDVFSVVNMCLDRLKICVVCFNVRMYVCYVISNKCDELQMTQPTRGGAVTTVTNGYANCVEPSCTQQWGPDLPFFGQAGHADRLDGWRCFSQKRVMSRLILVRQHHTNESGFAISALNKYMLGSRYP